MALLSIGTIFHLNNHLGLENICPSIRENRGKGWFLLTLKLLENLLQQPNKSLPYRGGEPHRIWRNVNGLRLNDIPVVQTRKRILVSGNHHLLYIPKYEGRYRPLSEKLYLTEKCLRTVESKSKSLNLNIKMR